MIFRDKSDKHIGLYMKFQKTGTGLCLIKTGFNFISLISWDCFKSFQTI